MDNPEIPDLDHFLAAPIDQVRAVAPKTMIYAPAGTRRAAMLANILPQGHDFAQWTQRELFRAIELIFDMGVNNLVMPMLGPSQFEELTPDYHEHLWDWFDWGLSGPEAIALYQEKGWRVRMAFSEFIPRIQAADDRLKLSAPFDNEKTLWCIAIPEYQLPYEWLFQAVCRDGVKNFEEGVRSLYGEAIPPAEIYLGSGKPLLSTLQLPPLLVQGPLQSYWSQQPGYSLDEPQLRTILHDFAYLRSTWQKDKTGRALEALKFRDLWEKGPTIGVGQRLGPYWYPQGT